MTGPWHALTLRHALNPRVKVLTFAMGMVRDSPGMGLHVDMTAHFFSGLLH